MATEKATWCDFELQTEPKFIEITTEDWNWESPKLSVLSMALKTHKNTWTKQKEIAMISCVIHERVDCDNNTPNPWKNYKHFSILWKLEDCTYPPEIQKEI